MPNPFKPDPVKKLIKPHGFDLVLIIDRSGSMSGTEEFIIEHYDKMVKGLKALNKNITLTTILFDHEFVIAYDGVSLSNITKLNYYANGSTALYDAWGAAIAHENERKKDKNNPYPDADVLYLTVTDGEENSSRIYDIKKIKDLMRLERGRSLEGHGIREFAMITDFGIDIEQLANDINLGENNSQTFYRGEAGIGVLFKTIGFAATNMLQCRKLTEKWIKDSDKLFIGSYPLGKLKEITKKQHKAFAQMEKAYVELSLAADEGLTKRFWYCYHEYVELVKIQKEAESTRTKDKELNALLQQYIAKNYGNQELALKQAKEATIKIASVKCTVCLGMIRKIAENPNATAEELNEAIYLYSEVKKKFNLLPEYYPDLKNSSVINEISYLFSDFDRRYNDIITDAFIIRTDLLKNAFGAGEKQLFENLGKFTQEPLKSLFINFSVYNEFCKWYETFLNEM